MKQLALVFFLLSLTGIVKSLTILPAEINTNTVLTKEFSPYQIMHDVTIEPGVVLQVEPGVVIEFGNLVSLIVKGQLMAIGTPEDSIYFVSRTGASPWLQINATNAGIDLQYCRIGGCKMLLYASGGNSINILHCNIESEGTSGGEDCIAVHDAKKVMISYVNLKGTGGTIAEGHKIDAIDLDHIDSCFVLRCNISRFGDDGIDIGTNSGYARIMSNNISHCNYGVSVGETSTANIHLNIITFCDAALQVHNNAVVNSSYNTFYANHWGIECYHSEEGTKQTGGKAYLSNTIFSATASEETLTQESSVLVISYSISDLETLSGEQNLTGDPLFVDPEGGDFSLQENSPCIGSGSPDTEGNRTTMGAVQTGGDPVSDKGIPRLPWDIYAFPNPTTGIIKIVVPPGEPAKKIIIYDPMGRAIKHVMMQQNALLLDLKEFPPGVYMMRLSAGNSYNVLKVIRE
jgi:hypothetical protein